MLNLDTKITVDDALIKSPNLTDRFSAEDLDRLGAWVHDGYTRDKASRKKWEDRNEAGMNLAMQLSEKKTFPWPNCSNIAFPLVTMAVLQFHSVAYPALIDGRQVVKCKPVGNDPQGKIADRVDRITRHMNYQVLEEDQAWEEQTDRLLINLPVVGSAFKKSYFRSSLGHTVSELVLARDLVMNYYAKSIEDCQRKTHIIPLYRNEIYERVMRGTFRDCREDRWYEQPPATQLTSQQREANKRQGIEEPMGDEITPFTTLEQHCWVDFDKDGYAEPYIITIEETSKKVLRIVARFEEESDIERNHRGEIVSIRPVEYFTKYSFIPSPDGGVYDIGFGVLLGPLNESTNTLINQLVDAGTMSNLAGGFLGRGAKIRGGVYTFAPLEWKRIDSTVDDLNKAIYPLPVREPSAVLFNLLSLLINFTSRIPGTTDAIMGENPGQNTPAETSRNMIAQGMKVFSVIFKRVWRSMKQEFRKLYILNSIYLPVRKVYGAEDDFILREDYLASPNSIVPFADPAIISQEMKIAKAQTIRAASMESPGGYDREFVEKNFLKALEVDQIDLVYPGLEAKPAPPHPKLQIEQIKAQTAVAKQQAADKLAIIELMEERRVNDAKIRQLDAQAAKLLAEAGGVETGHQIAALEAAIGALKVHNDSINDALKLMLEQTNGGDKRAGLSGMEASSGNQGASSAAGGMG